MQSKFTGFGITMRALTLTLMTALVAFPGVATAQPDERGGRDERPGRGETDYDAPERGNGGWDNRGQGDRRSEPSGWFAGKGEEGMNIPGRLTRKLLERGTQQRLGLTEAQVEALRDQALGIERQSNELEIDLKQVRLGMQREMERETPTRGAVLGLVEREGRLQTELNLLAVNEHFDVRDLLTAEQLDRLPMFRSRGERDERDSDRDRGQERDDDRERDREDKDKGKDKDRGKGQDKQRGGGNR